MAEPFKALRARFESFATPKFEEREIRGHKFHFYSLSSSMLFACRTSATPILKALGTLMGESGKSDRGSRVKEVVNPIVLDLSEHSATPSAPAEGDAAAAQQMAPTSVKAGKGVFVQRSVETIDSPAESDVIKLRDKMRRDSIGEIMDQLLGDECKILVGRCILDSLRDDFPECRGGGNSKMKDEMARQFMEDPDNDLETLKLFIFGLGAGNKDLFGPLGHQIAELVRTGGGLLVDKVRSALDEKANEETTPKPTT